MNNSLVATNEQRRQASLLSACEAIPQIKGQDKWDHIVKVMRALQGQDSLADFISACEKDPSLILDRVNSATSHTIPTKL